MSKLASFNVCQTPFRSGLLVRQSRQRRRGLADDRNSEQGKHRAGGSGDERGRNFRSQVSHAVRSDLGDVARDYRARKVIFGGKASAYSDRGGGVSTSLGITRVN